MREDLLDALLETQAKAWAEGNCVEVERLIAGTPPAEIDDELLKWLLVGEIKLRRDRGDSSQLLVEIESRFPKLASDVWEFVEFSNSLSVEPRDRQGSISPPENSAIGAAAAGSGEETTLLNGKGFLSDVSPAETPNNRRDPTKPDSRQLTTTKKSGTSTLPQLDDYELFRELGRGGFGAVYLGKNHCDNSLAAVKFVSNYGNVEIEGLRALRRCSADHPSLTPILYVGKRPGFLIYTMPLANSLNQTTEESTPSHADSAPESWANYVAHSLAAELKLRRRLTVDQSLELLRTLLAGLVELHQHQVIHSDVKPANILRIGSTWKLADMGLAIVNESGDKGQSRRGTQAYWPANKETGTVAHDLFATGITLWSCLTGQSATEFPGRTARLAVDPTIPSQDRGIAKQLFHVINGICQTPGSEPITTASAALNQLPAPSSHRIERRRFFWRMAAAGIVLCTGTAAGVMFFGQSQMEPYVSMEDLEVARNDLRSKMAGGDWSAVITKCNELINGIGRTEGRHSMLTESLMFWNECRDIALGQSTRGESTLTNVWNYSAASIVNDNGVEDLLLEQRGRSSRTRENKEGAFPQGELLSGFLSKTDPIYAASPAGTALIKKLESNEFEIVALTGDLDVIEGLDPIPQWIQMDLYLRCAAQLRGRFVFIRQQLRGQDELRENPLIEVRIVEESRRLADLCELCLGKARELLFKMGGFPPTAWPGNFGAVATSRSWRNHNRIGYLVKVDMVEFLDADTEDTLNTLSDYLAVLEKSRDSRILDHRLEITMEQHLLCLTMMRVAEINSNQPLIDKFEEMANSKLEEFRLKSTSDKKVRTFLSGALGNLRDGRLEDYQSTKISVMLGD